MGLVEKVGQNILAVSVSETAPFFKDPPPRVALTEREPVAYHW